MDINSSILVTGTIRMLNDIITALTGISILVATIMGIWYLVKKSSCDEHEGKRLLVAIACCVMITLIKVIIQVITSYYT